MVRSWIAFVVLLTVCTGLASAMCGRGVWILPGNFVSLSPGSTITVVNATATPAIADIRLDDGTSLANFVVPPQSQVDFVLKKDAALIGHKVLTKVSNGTESDATTNPIVLDGSVTVEAQEFAGDVGSACGARPTVACRELDAGLAA